MKLQVGQQVVVRDGSVMTVTEKSWFDRRSHFTSNGERILPMKEKYLFAGDTGGFWVAEDEVDEYTEFV